MALRGHLGYLQAALVTLNLTACANFELHENHLRGLGFTDIDLSFPDWSVVNQNRGRLEIAITRFEALNPDGKRISGYVSSDFDRDFVVRFDK